MQNGVVEIFTDGAASPNPGPGGYGVIIVDGDQRRELAGGYRETTNNRMELMAAIRGLQAVTGERRDVVIFSDSRYVVDMIEGGYAARWRARGWMRDTKHRAENPDLWGELLDGAALHSVKFRWVRGHSDHAGNERCDSLAVAARQQAGLPPDEPFERGRKAALQQTMLDLV
jgi:ribonuclease HI